MLQTIYRIIVRLLSDKNVRDAIVVLVVVVIAALS